MSGRVEFVDYEARVRAWRTCAIIALIVAAFSTALAIRSGGFTISPPSAQAQLAALKTMHPWEFGIPFEASAISDIYHRQGCRHARQINHDNRIGFNDRNEATRAGFRPCKRCRP